MDLHKALLKGDFSGTRRLIESGVDVNERDAEDRTPLMLCCLHDGEDWAVGVARMLLMHNGQVGLSDSHGRSALIYAVLYQRVGLVQMFLQALDFDLNACDLTGQTALDYANQTGNQPIKKLLLQAMRWSSPMSGRSTTKLCNQKLFHSQSSLQSDTSSSSNLLPYKTLPKEMWTNREPLQRKLKPKHLPDSRAVSKTNIKSGHARSSLVQNPKPGTINVHSTKLRTNQVLAQGTSKVKEKPGNEMSPTVTQNDWRLDMRSLMDALQAQNSASYRPTAQPRPQAPKQRRRPSRAVRSRILCRQRDRKMSLGDLDDVQEKERRVSFRRRCTVASIPIIQPSKTRRPSIPGLDTLRLGGGRSVKPSNTAGK